MAYAGAAKTYLFTNAGAACVVAIVFYGKLHVKRRSTLLAASFIAPVLLVLTFAGPAIDGVHRWIALGPVKLHVAMLVLPFLATSLFSHNKRGSAAVFTVVALAIALQPDRASALALLFMSLCWLLLTRERWPLVTFAVSSAALLGTILTADTLPSVPFVENVIGDAAAIHVSVAVLLLIGMLVPISALLYAGSRCEPDRRTALFAWSACLTGYFLASLVGPYPVPLLGYGVSPILGFGLALAIVAGASDETA